MKSEQKQVTFRAPADFFDRMDKIAERMTRPGLVVTATDVLRIAAFKGLEELEAEASVRSEKKGARR